MSELFANLGGFRQPDVRMNQGPLPSMAGGPTGSNGTVDGVINGTGALLGGITPYAYGESARAGSDSNYQQIPHRVQYIVMPLHLPAQNGLSTHKVSHVVDNGDLAFVLNTRGRQWFGPGDNVLSAGPVSLPLFANLEVVNYILACMQLAPVVAAGAPGKRSWAAIRGHLWKQAFDEKKCRGDAQERAEHLFECVQYTLQNLFKPHGICAGSEKQGGQHEETWAPVQAAVNYTTTMTVDGQNRDLINYWHSMHICAGDRLIFRLEPRNEGGGKNHAREFQLTSYYKRPVSATIAADKLYWQVVPHILHADAPLAAGEQLAWHDYRLTGHWHIAQSFQGRRGFDAGAAAHKGAPLQVTFAPMFVPGDGGRREDAFFTRDALNEVEVVSEADIIRKLQECGVEVEAGVDVPPVLVYDEIMFQAFLRKMGVRVATMRILFGKPSQRNFIARMMATTGTMMRALGVAMLYKFAMHYKIYRMQTYLLRTIHSNKWEGLIHGTEQKLQDFLKNVRLRFDIKPEDPRMLEWIVKYGGPEAANQLRHGGLIGGAPHVPARLLRRDARVIVGDASAAFEANFATAAALAANAANAANAENAPAPRKRAAKRSSLFGAAGAVVEGEAASSDV